MLNCHASIRGLFGGMIVFSCTMVSIILYVVLRHKPDDLSSNKNHHSHVNSTISSRISNRRQSTSKTDYEIDYSIAILEILNLFLLALSLFATIWSLIKIRKLNYRPTATRKIK
jgi:hypothetical protein